VIGALLEAQGRDESRTRDQGRRPTLMSVIWACSIRYSQVVALRRCQRAPVSGSMLQLPRRWRPVTSVHVCPAVRLRSLEASISFARSRPWRPLGQLLRDAESSLSAQSRRCC